MSVFIVSEAKSVILPGEDYIVLHHLLSFYPYSIGKDMKFGP